MNQAANILLEHNDFTSFAKLHTKTRTNICRISRAEWTEDGFSISSGFGKSSNYELRTSNSELIFTITADRFLRNMVRAIVGTLLDVGREKITPDEFRNIINSRNRSAAGASVPPHALFLTDIKYPHDVLY
jgi:tRNA pseudouridine38-40 synthase